MMISYSANFEDVMLSRAFNGHRDGHYIDVGAHTAVAGSNTYALYAKGWNGIACDPIFNFELAWPIEWASVRPRDLLVRDAIGSEMGKTEYWLCSLRGLSTCDRGRINEFAVPDSRPELEDGAEISVVPLNRVIEKLLDGKAPELICIDVEGFEGTVLKGIDLKKYRPWIFCIEAYNAVGMLPHYQGWEPQLVANGYHFVWDDRLNRFYVANEHAELDEHFIYPPNFSDGFIPHKQYEQECRIRDYEDTRAILKTLR